MSNAILDTFYQKIMKINWYVFEKTRWRLKTSKNHFSQKSNSYLAQIWSKHVSAGTWYPARRAGPWDRKWIYGEFSNVHHKKSFSQIGEREISGTGSDINMRISPLDTRNITTCPNGARFSIFISTSGPKIIKVKNVKIAFRQNMSTSIACCGQTGSTIHTQSSQSYIGRSSTLITENRMTIG